MVLAGEGSGQRSGQQSLGLQRRDSDGRRQNLRDRPEKSSLPQLSQRPLQREAGKRRPRVPPDVPRADAVRAGVRSQVSGLRSYPLEAEQKNQTANDVGPEN